MSLYCGSSGFIHYALIFAKDKIVAAKIGKSREFDEAAVGAVYFGVIGAIFGARSKKRRRDRLEEELRKLKGLRLDEISKMEKENFVLPYENIERVEMKTKSSGPIGILRIEGSIASILRKIGLTTKVGLIRKKPRRWIDFRISRNQDFEQCRSIISKALQNKLATK